MPVRRWSVAHVGTRGTLPDAPRPSGAQKRGRQGCETVSSSTGGLARGRSVAASVDVLEPLHFVCVRSEHVDEYEFGTPVSARATSYRSDRATDSEAVSDPADRPYEMLVSGAPLTYRRLR